jgi:tRNA-specific adenosine deaminase 3
MLHSQGILVNPESNSEVLRCLGKTDHPLRHCVMVIAGELGKLPCLSDEDEPLDHKTKRARHELQQDDAPTLSAGDSRAASAASESAAVERRTDGYIMSDLDLYLSHEPCVMCSMALVHSRVSRLFYAKDFPERGAIGSGWGIHQHPGLNHHYKAFKAIKGPR